MPRKGYVRASFPNLLKKERDEASTSIGKEQSPSTSFGSLGEDGLLRRSSAVKAQERMAALNDKPPTTDPMSSRRSNRISQTPAKKPRYNNKRSPEYAEYESDEEDEEDETMSDEAPQVDTRSKGAIRSAIWRQNRKAEKEELARQAEMSNAHGDERRDMLEDNDIAWAAIQKAQHLSSQTATGIANTIINKQPRRSSNGKLREAPPRGPGGKFLSDFQKEEIAAGRPLPPPKVLDVHKHRQQYSRGAKSKLPEGADIFKLHESDADEELTPQKQSNQYIKALHPVHVKRKGNNQYTKAREEREAAERAGQSSHVARKGNNQYTKAREAAERMGDSSYVKRKGNNQYTKARAMQQALDRNGTLTAQIPKTPARIIYVNSHDKLLDGPLNKLSKIVSSPFRMTTDSDETILLAENKCKQCQSLGVKCNGGSPACHWCHQNGLACSFLGEETAIAASEGIKPSPISLHTGDTTINEDATEVGASQAEISASITDSVENLNTFRKLDLNPISYHLHTAIPCKGRLGHIKPTHLIGFPLGDLTPPILPTDPRYTRPLTTHLISPTHTLSQEESFITKPSIRITIPDYLKNILVDDWENVTKSLLLVPLPSQAPANYIIDSYYDEEKLGRRLGSAEADILMEFCAGLKVYFEKSIGKILLYRFERSQLAEVCTTLIVRVSGC